MNQEIKVSERIRVIANYITPGTTFADIGSDHAYLPCYVCAADPNIKAIAGEVNRGPYESAKRTVEAYSMSKCIDVRLGDGLEVIDPTVSEIVIAGMGGSLIKSILEDGEHKLSSVNRMIVQPNNNEHQVRNVLLKYQFTITEELIIEENNHIYEIIIAERNLEADPYSPNIEFEYQQMFGPLLMHKKSSVFMKKWQKEYTNYQRIIQTMQNAKQQDKVKIALFQQRLTWIEEVLENGANQS